MQLDTLSKLGIAGVVVIGFSLTPNVANAVSITFAPPTGFGSSLTINDKVSSKDTTNTLDTNSTKNIIQFSRIFSNTANPNQTINVSGTLFAETITYKRDQNKSVVLTSGDGINAVIVTLTNFTLTNNTGSILNVNDFIKMSHDTSVSMGSLTSHYGSIVGTSTSPSNSSYYEQYNYYSNLNLGICNPNSNPLTNCYLQSPSTRVYGYGTNFSDFDDVGGWDTTLSNTNLTLTTIQGLLDVNLENGKSLNLPNSLATLTAATEKDELGNEVKLTQKEIELLSSITLQKLEAEGNQTESVPEPSSLLGLLTLSGLFTFGFRKNNQKN